jgi:hypothetical protein
MECRNNWREYLFASVSLDLDRYTNTHQMQRSHKKKNSKMQQRKKEGVLPTWNLDCSDSSSVYFESKVVFVWKASSHATGYYTVYN